MAFQKPWQRVCARVAGVVIFTTGCFLGVSVEKYGPRSFCLWLLAYFGAFVVIAIGVSLWHAGAPDGKGRD